MLSFVAASRVTPVGSATRNHSYQGWIIGYTCTTLRVMSILVLDLEQTHTIFFGSTEQKSTIQSFHSKSFLGELDLALKTVQSYEAQLVKQLQSQNPNQNMFQYNYASWFIRI